jgi:hypothetical protein
MKFIVTRAATAIVLHRFIPNKPSDIAVSLGSDHPHDL